LIKRAIAGLGVWKVDDGQIGWTWLRPERRRGRQPAARRVQVGVLATASLLEAVAEEIRASSCAEDDWSAPPMRPTPTAAIVVLASGSAEAEATNTTPMMLAPIPVSSASTSRVRATTSPAARPPATRRS
jgi:hypothetical protein